MNSRPRCRRGDPSVLGPPTSRPVHHRHFTVHGVTIPGSSPSVPDHRVGQPRPPRLPDPDRFDIARTDLPAPLGLGFGVHYCIGAALARTEPDCPYRLVTRFPDYSESTNESGLERVHMANVAGFSQVPFLTHLADHRWGTVTESRPGRNFFSPAMP